MQKKTIFLLFIFSFIAGFFLREILLGVSQNKYLETEEIDTYKNDFEDAGVNEGPLLELVKIEAPLKTFRGRYLEGIVYLKILRMGQGSYNLYISLNNISSVKHQIVVSQDWIVNKLIKAPFSISIPESAKLGGYIIGAKLTNLSGDRETELPIAVKNDTNELNNKIEIVSYNN